MVICSFREKNRKSFLVILQPNNKKTNQITFQKAQTPMKITVNVVFGFRKKISNPFSPSNNTINYV